METMRCPYAGRPHKPRPLMSLFPPICGSVRQTPLKPYENFRRLCNAPKQLSRHFDSRLSKYTLCPMRTLGHNRWEERLCWPDLRCGMGRQGEKEQPRSFLHDRYFSGTKQARLWGKVS